MNIIVLGSKLLSGIEFNIQTLYWKNNNRIYMKYILLCLLLFTNICNLISAMYLYPLFIFEKIMKHTQCVARIGRANPYYINLVCFLFVYKSQHREILRTLEGHSQAKTHRLDVSSESDSYSGGQACARAHIL